MEGASNNETICPICNEKMAQNIYNDHLICHQLENEDNLNISLNLNPISNNNINLNPNQNQNNNNSIPLNTNNNNQNNQNNTENSNFFSRVYNMISSPFQNKNENNSQPNSNNNINNNNDSNVSNNNNSGFFEKIFNMDSLNPFSYNNNSSSNNNNNNQNNNSNNNNNNSQQQENNFFQTLSNTISTAVDDLKEMGSRIINEAESNPTVRTVILNNNPVRLMRNYQQNNLNNNQINFVNNNNQPVNLNNNNIPPINSVPLQNSYYINSQIMYMPPIIIGERGHVIDINEYRNNINALMNNNDNDQRISQDELNKIMEYLPSSVLTEKKEGENSECVVCISGFEAGDSITTLPCAHIFHTECVKSWLETKNHCPVCKFEITLNSLLGRN